VFCPRGILGPWGEVFYPQSPGDKSWWMGLASLVRGQCLLVVTLRHIPAYFTDTYIPVQQRRPCNAAAVSVARYVALVAEWKGVLHDLEMV